MKKIFTTLFLPALISPALAQLVTDQVSTGANYQTQVWYSMANGEVGSAPLNNWDIAFEISGFTASIRANTQKGVEVYAAPYSIAQWAEVDITDMTESWEMLYDDPKAWSKGAFNKHITSNFDLGWGIYNMVTHFVVGDSIQVIKLANGEYKKIRIDVLSGGTYYFTYANIDGSDEVSASIAKSNFQGKNFAYYNLETGDVLDREPLSDTWDITFTRYTDLVNDTPYPVTGVLHNYNASVSEVADTPVETATPWETGFSNEINTIGYDWKTFDFSLGFVVAENHSYFVQTSSGEVYQLVFTAFGGSANGVYEFGQQLFSATSVEELSDSDFLLYPNPASYGEINLTGEFSQGKTIHIFDISGREIEAIRAQASNLTRINLDGYTSGTYVVRIVSNGQTITKKLIITQ